MKKFLMLIVAMLFMSVVGGAVFFISSMICVFG